MKCEHCNGTGEILQCIVCKKVVERHTTAIMLYRDMRLSYGPFCDACVPVLKPVEEEYAKKEANHD